MLLIKDFIFGLWNYPIHKFTMSSGVDSFSTYIQKLQLQQIT